jgi:hypothetical protein
MAAGGLAVACKIVIGSDFRVEPESSTGSETLRIEMGM